MIDKNQLRDLIDNTLLQAGWHSEAAINLLMGTAAVESRCGTYIRQIKGPALGIFQMEPATFKSHLKWLYERGFKYSDKVFEICNIIKEDDPECLAYNLKAAILFARIHYLRVPEPLPQTIEGMAYYWKRYYNTYLGKGTEEKFIKAYKAYAL